MAALVLRRLTGLRALSLVAVVQGARSVELPGAHAIRRTVRGPTIDVRVPVTAVLIGISKLLLVFWYATLVALVVAVAGGASS